MVTPTNDLSSKYYCYGCKKNIAQCGPDGCAIEGEASHWKELYHCFCDPSEWMITDNLFCAPECKYKLN